MSRVTNNDIFSKYFNVIELKHCDFKEKEGNLVVKSKKVNKNYNGICMFYSPNCDKCHRLVEKWNELGLFFTNKNICSVNCHDMKNKNNQLCDSMDVYKYPTIFNISIDGELVKYVGRTSQEDLFNELYM
jgi:hypothetical protein